MRIKTPQKRVQFSRTLRMAILGVFGVLTLFTAVSLLLTTKPATAAVSSTINFQARLENASGSIVPDGYYNVEFKLYSASSGGTAEWTEDYTYNSGPSSADERIRVANGYLTVSLGSLCAFTTGSCQGFSETAPNWNQQQWLTMNIGGPSNISVSWDGEMSPRIQLTAVPYAFQAGELGNGTNKATLDSSGNLYLQQAGTVGTSTGQLTVQGATSLVLQSTTMNSVTLDSGTTGNVNIGTGSNAKTLTIGNTTGATAITLQSGTGAINLQTQGTGGINIATNAVAQTVTIGNTTGASSVVLQGGSGGVKVATLGSWTSNSAALCRDTSTNILTACDTTNSSGAAFLQGGNSFGATGTLGTNDGNNLAFETNNTTRLIIDTSATTNFTLQQASNILVASAATGTALTIQGGAATSGTNVGGSLILQGGAGASTGASGSVIVRSNTNNSTTAFVVQNASSVALLTADTTNQNVAVSANTSSASATLSVTQAGSGDATIAISNASQNWSLGVDSSYINSFNVAAANAIPATTTTNIGNTSAGTNTDSINGNQIDCTNAFTPATSGYVTSLSARTGTNADTAPNNAYSLALYDSNGYPYSPYKLIGSATGTLSATPGLNTLSVNSLPVIGGRQYFVCANNNSTNNNLSNWKYDATGNGRYVFSYSYSNGWPSTMVSTSGTPNISYDFYATMVSTAAPFTLSTSGTATFKPTTDSTAAFEVQNSSGLGVVSVDTTNKTLNVMGSSASATYGSELNTGTFSSPVGNWTTTGWTIGGGGTTATHNTGNSSVLTYNGFTFTSGVIYQVTVDVGGTCGSGGLTVGGVSGTGDDISSLDCNYSDHTFIATGDTGDKLQLIPSSTWTGTVSYVSIKQITAGLQPALAIQEPGYNGNTLELSAKGSSIFFGGNGRYYLNGEGVGENTAFGISSLENIADAFSETAIGANALQYQMYGYENTAVGDNALNALNVGNDNTALGAFTLDIMINGSNNVAIGSVTLHNHIVGDNNTVVGTYSLYNNISGTNNVALGYKTGYDTTGSNNSFVGYQAGYQDSGGNFATTTSVQNAAAIGAYAQVQASNSIVLGSVDTATKIGIGTTVPDNTFSVSPVDYQSGTVTRTNGSATLVGTSTGWGSSVPGDLIIFADGTTNTVSSYTDGTHITMGSTYTGTTDASPVHYRFHHIGLQVTSGGVVNISAMGGSSSVLNVGGVTGLVASFGNAAGSSNSNYISVANGRGMFGNDGSGNVTLQSTSTENIRLAVNSSTFGSGTVGLTVSSSTGNVIIGTGTTGEATAKLLILDSKNTGDSLTPGTTTCTTNGSVYYNSSDSQFRACRNGKLYNLIAGVDVQSWTTGGTYNNAWVKPSGVSVVMVVMCGAGGGGGGGGSRGNTGTNTAGAGGGGGGARTQVIMVASDVSTPQSVIVGTGGGGAAASGTGTTGGTSQFGSLVKAGGGGGGPGGSTSNTTGGGGGGQVTQGQSNGTGGEGSTSSSIGFSGGGTAAGVAGGLAETGGGGGGGAATQAAGQPGGGSVYGGGGGGAGGGTTTNGTSSFAGAAGGASGTYATAGGGTAGGTFGGAGGSGAAGSSARCGSGGGGGGSNPGSNTTGGIGGPGGSAGGGGGGGGTGTSTGLGGAGGDGGDGAVWVISW